MSVKTGLLVAASAYRRTSRYFFYAILALTLLATMTGVFAQSQQQPQLTLTISNIEVNTVPPTAGRGGGSPGATSISGTVTVQGSWSGGPLHFGGWAAVTGYNIDPSKTYVNNITLTSGSFNPQSLAYPSQTSTSFSATHQGGFTQWVSYEVAMNAYNQKGQIVGTTSQSQGATSQQSDLYRLVVELPLFQVPELGISASNPEFSNLFATFDQLPLGSYYMLLAEVAIIFVIGAGMVNFILYLNGSGSKNDVKTLAGLNNIMMTLLMIFLLPYAYNAIAGFANVLNQQIIAGPNTPYTSYNDNLLLLNSNLNFGGNFFTDVIGWIAGIFVWVFEHILGVARLFLIGSVVVAMPIVLVLRDIRFTSRFAGAIEDTFMGLIFATVISSLFLGLAANILKNYDGSIFAAAGVEKNWVALAALLGAILAPTVFAPLTGTFFQTMSQVGMAAAGTAFAIGAGALGPASAGISGGASAAGQALGGLATSNPSAGLMQRAGVALGGFTGAFGRAVPSMAHNMILMGTVGGLGGLGASRSASAINRAIDLKMPAQTTQSIVAHRGGMLASELKLPSEMRTLIGRALGVGVHHDRIRALDIQHHNDLDRLQDAIRSEVNMRLGR